MQLLMSTKRVTIVTCTTTSLTYFAVNCFLSVRSMSLDGQSPPDLDVMMNKTVQEKADAVSAFINTARLSGGRATFMAGFAYYSVSERIFCISFVFSLLPLLLFLDCCVLCCM